MYRVGKLKNKRYDIGMRYLYTLLTILCFAVSVTHAEALEIKVAPDISINENYISDQNIYMAGLRTWFNTIHNKDVVSAAFEQTISGTIFGDVLLLGNKVNVTSELFDDIRILANHVSISGVSNKDLVIIARSVSIEPGAILNGDTLILANTVSTQGQILGQTQITANSIYVAGSISGITNITGQRIFFSKDSQIASQLSYFSPQRAIIEEGAQIEDKLNYNQIESISENDLIKKIFFGFVSFWAIIKLVATLFMILIITQLFRVFAQRLVNIVHLKKLYALLIGVISIIVIPLLIVILFGSLVLLPVSLILGFVFGIMIILLPALSAIIVASWYQKYVLKQQKDLVTFNVSALALVLLTFIGFVPYIGSLVIYALYLISFGAMTTYIYEQVRRKNIQL